MKNQAPERLLNEQYMTLSVPCRLFLHEIDRPVATHWHEFYEMALVLSGTGTHTMNGVPTRMEPGFCFLLTPADFHALIPDTGQTIVLYNLIFTEHFIRDPLPQLLFENVSEHIHHFDMNEQRMMQAEYERIWRETACWQVGSELILRGCIERLLVELTRGCRSSQAAERTDSAPKRHPSIRKALIYIQHHFREPLTLDEVAGLSGLSRNYFSERFSEQTGSSFQTYLQELRLNFARSLLKTTDLPITEIGFASGFNTLPHFERAFKKKYAASPRAFRKQGGD